MASFYFQKFELAMNTHNVPGVQLAMQREGGGGEGRAGEE